ncbi:MAG: hypothetical protein OXF23_00605 [Candidatus Dadabacteria bacterium]|nr:hypothetical protein [Candidatus Dadabacteria bacterium]
MPAAEPIVGVATQNVHLEQLKAIYEQNNILRKQTQLLHEQTQLLRESHSLVAEYLRIMKGPTIGNGLGFSGLGPGQSNPRG